ncbi:MAG: DUF4365 domain-containing protein [Gemmataceae bacterium]
MLLTENNIKAELSYAYLHAVASRAGFGCEVAGRMSDGAGVDALVRFKERLAPDAVLTESVIEVQLKATSEPAVLHHGRCSFFLRRDHYDKLRAADIGLRRFLVVFFLPESADDWLGHSADQLLLKRCAYWCSLRGAGETANKSGQTVYLPHDNAFSVAGLRGLMTRVSRNETWCDGSE